MGASTAAATSSSCPGCAVSSLQAAELTCSCCDRCWTSDWAIFPITCTKTRDFKEAVGYLYTTPAPTLLAKR